MKSIKYNITDRGVTGVTVMLEEQQRDPWGWTRAEEYEASRLGEREWRR